MRFRFSQVASGSSACACVSRVLSARTCWSQTNNTGAHSGAPAPRRKHPPEHTALPFSYLSGEWLSPRPQRRRADDHARAPAPRLEHPPEPPHTARAVEEGQPLGVVADGAQGHRKLEHTRVQTAADLDAHALAVEREARADFGTLACEHVDIGKGEAG